jgi:hypothetical protein
MHHVSRACGRLAEYGFGDGFAEISGTPPRSTTSTPSPESTWNAWPDNNTVRPCGGSEAAAAGLPSSATNTVPLTAEDHTQDGHRPVNPPTFCPPGWPPRTVSPLGEG